MGFNYTLDPDNNSGEIAAAANTTQNATLSISRWDGDLQLPITQSLKECPQYLGYE